MGLKSDLVSDLIFQLAFGMFRVWAERFQAGLSGAGSTLRIGVSMEGFCEVSFFPILNGTAVDC